VAKGVCWIESGESGAGIVVQFMNAEGLSHYIPRGWLGITWKGIDGLQYDF